MVNALAAFAASRRGASQALIPKNGKGETMSSTKPVVMVTGSSGLIGSRLADALADRYQVVGLDVKPPAEGGEQAAFVECDLTDAESVAEAMRQVKNQFGRALASVVHLAAYYDFSGEPSPLYEELTVGGTRRLLLSLSDFNVEQFVFSSSLLVMKPAEEGEEVSETSPAEAAWDYPESKLDAEAVIRQLHADTPAVILRIAGVYDEQGHSIPIAQQISRIHQKQLESYFFPGDADHGQAFVHLDDLIDCFVKTIENRGQLGDYEIFLIAEPDVMSYAELQDRIGELLHGREWPTIRIPKAVAKAGAWVKDKLASEDEPAFIKPWMVDLADQHYPVAIERARAKLGWEPKRRLRETLNDMIASLKDDPQAWYQENGLPPPDLD
jgi:nucleoside-diphosphate-sugar epimerase